MKSGMFSKIRNGFIDFVIAPKANCLGCMSSLGAGESYLCSNCYASLSPLYMTFAGVKKICRRCGREIDGLRCTCHESVNKAYTTYSAYYFERPVSTLVKSFKYKSVTNLSDWITDEMIKALKNDRDFDLIACVPMHPLRKLKRGFNQSEVLAKRLSEKIRIPYASLLKRRRLTRRQATLRGARRKTNLINAFGFNGIDVSGKRILIVDDVRTTGTTLITCANLLMEKGAGKVSAVTLACGHSKKS